MKPSFTITARDKTTRARAGILRTPHGIIRTPSYVIVATHARIRMLTPADIRKTGTQIVIANTYHLWDKPQMRRTFGMRLPMMTDSGGFQVFSLGAAKDHAVGKVLRRVTSRTSKVIGTSNVCITEKGVYFVVDGKKRFLSPEISMAIQERLGADIIFAFDECTSPLHPYAYQKTSIARTHRWAARCLATHTKKDQLLFGIVQGGRFASLRKQSARTIGAMSFDGFGIGGSFGKDEMARTLDWVIPHLPDDKPRHLLGIGTVADIFTAVQAGVDTFDCVIPTREARHGRIYTDTGTRHVKINTPADARAATIRNVRWFNLLLKKIRAALGDGSYHQFKKKFLTTFSAKTRTGTRSPERQAC